MCGIFGLIAAENSNLSQARTRKIVKELYKLSESRGKESAGIAIKNSFNNSIHVLKESKPASTFIKESSFKSTFQNGIKGCFGANGKVEKSFAVIAHTRLVTNGSQDDNDNNQPIVKNNAVGVHNGIICNIEELWDNHKDLNRQFEVDTELLVGMIYNNSKKHNKAKPALKEAFAEVEGTISTSVLLGDSQQILLGTNNGSLYYMKSDSGKTFIFSSEKLILEALKDRLKLESSLGKLDVTWAGNDKGFVIDGTTLDFNEFSLNGETTTNDDLHWDSGSFEIKNYSKKEVTPFPNINNGKESHYRSLFEFNIEKISELKRCSKCLLPETFPFIVYDNDGVCNFCHNHRNLEFKGRKAIEEFIKPHRKTTNEPDCIVTLSGGRDSCYGLHYMKEELGMNPIAYTYDWGMVTDLARRNQARMCGKLGVEHILISADIKKKRKNIQKNVKAWLKKPHLGTIPLFMAGDKQYFYWAHVLQKKHNINLVVLCENMLETTNFKSGFCGIKPSFDENKHTYSLSAFDKFKMMAFYGKEYLVNPSYLNSSMLDTMHAFWTYYFLPRDFMNMFDYIEWKEKEVENLLFNHYNWEMSPDTTTSWRIGDGTAAFYNYIYYNVAGFSEFDTFRSNQIREGMITREEGLEFVNQENKPRYESFKWYCDTIGLDLEKTVKRINRIPKLYEKALA